MKISACMIAKNEEENLPRCLRSITDIVDEIILVDTGSIDDTIGIAENFGAWVHRKPWNGNFAAARNYALSKCSGEWILWIDADEELECKKTRHELHETLEKIPDHGVVRLPIENIYNGKRSGAIALADRFFRRQPGVQWKGKIHERVTHRGKEAHALFMKILHYGYDLPPEEMAKKAQRNLDILMDIYHKQMRWSWGGPKPVIYRYIIQSFFAMKDEDRCIHYAEEYYDKRDRFKDQYAPDTCYSMFMLYALKNNVVDATRWLKLGESLYPNNIDINYCRYFLGKTTRDQFSIITGGLRYIDAYKKISIDCAHLGGGITMTYTPTHCREVLTNLVTTHLAFAIASNQTLNQEMKDCPLSIDLTCRKYVENMASHLQKEFSL